MRQIPMWSRVVFLALLPFVIYSAWNYVEFRRIRSRIDAIQRRGEPLTAFPGVPDANERSAERLYRAAAALATMQPYNERIADGIRLGQTWPNGQWTPETLAFARAAVDANGEALALVDRAARLPFRSFDAGTSYNYRTSELMTLSRLLEFRAAVSTSDGRSDAALDSFYSDAKLARALDASPIALGAFLPRFAGLSAAAAADPRASNRAVLAGAFADLDRDDRLKRALMNTRAGMLSGPSGLRSTGTGSYPANPVVGHMAVAQLDVFAALIAAADAPWPRRIDDMNAIGMWPLGFATRNAATSSVLANFTKSTANQVKAIRCARLIVSDVPLDLVDPFTGRRLEPSQCRL